MGRKLDELSTEFGELSMKFGELRKIVATKRQFNELLDGQQKMFDCQQRMLDLFAQIGVDGMSGRFLKPEESGGQCFKLLKQGLAAVLPGPQT